MKNVFFILLIFQISIFAEKKDGVMLITRPMPDSIMLRWAPNTAKAWELGNKYGYMVARYTILRNYKLIDKPEYTLLTKDTLKVAPFKTWEILSEHDEDVAIAANSIFGSEFKNVKIGNNVMLAFKKYEEQQQRYGFALFTADKSPLVARLSALKFTDKTAKNNEKYLYRVFIKAPDTMSVDTGYVFTGISEYTPLPKPLELKATWGNKKVSLSWNIQYLKHYYNSYYIEKSADDGKTYTKAFDKPTVSIAEPKQNPQYIFKSDTLTENDKTYYYRVRGISSFGEISPPSDSVFGKGFEPIEQAPSFIGNKVIDNKAVMLEWFFPEKDFKNITGYKIYKSKNPNKNFKLLASIKTVDTKVYIDTTPKFTNYYKISAFKDSTQEKMSFVTSFAQLIDSIPPAIPKNIIGKVDSLGNVKLSWNPSPDEDVLGYRVYKANSDNDEYSQITHEAIKDTLFQEQIVIKTLSPNVYYKVSAVDKMQNESKRSEKIELERPDVVPPVEPSSQRFESSEEGPILKWICSSSIDVVRYELYRKTDYNSKWELLKTFAKTDSSYISHIDTKADIGFIYSYCLVAVDKAGNKSSFRDVISVKKIDSGVREGVTDFDYDRDENGIKLTWKTPSKNKDKILHYSIFRKLKTDEDFVKLIDVSGDKTEFVDKSNYENGNIFYKIRVVYNDFKTSPLSKELKVR